jgi:hypothetical protein
VITVSDTQGPYREGEQVRLKLSNGQTVAQWGTGTPHEWELLIANAAYLAGAEAMREAVLEDLFGGLPDHHYHLGFTPTIGNIRSRIRSLPLPGQAARGTPT